MSRLRIIGLAAIMLGVAAPAAAQGNAYGGHDIVAYEGSESFYGKARGWNVFSAASPSGFAFCFAETVRSDGRALRIGWDGMQWQLAVPVTSTPDWQGTLQIDGRGSGQGYGRGGDDISGTAVRAWTIAWLGLAELDGLRNGRVAVLGVGRSDFDFPLTGSTAAIQKVEECVQRSGGAAAQPAASDGSSERSRQVYATAGDWVINELRLGSQVKACEAYDTVQTTLRFEIDRDNSYIDFSDRGPMGGLGARVSVLVGFDTGDTPAPYDAEIIEGHDGNVWGRITEGRMDGPGLLDDAFLNAAQVSFQGRGIILERGLDGSGRALDAMFRCSDGIR
jgi:hypothetical protein